MAVHRTDAALATLLAGRALWGRGHRGIYCFFHGGSWPFVLVTKGAVPGCATGLTPFVGQPGQKMNGASLGLEAIGMQEQVRWLAFPK